MATEIVALAIVSIMCLFFTALILMGGIGVGVYYIARKSKESEHFELCTQTEWSHRNTEYGWNHQTPMYWWYVPHLSNTDRNKELKEIEEQLAKLKKEINEALEKKTQTSAVKENKCVADNK